MNGSIYLVNSSYERTIKVLQLMYLGEIIGWFGVELKDDKVENWSAEKSIMSILANDYICYN